MTSARVTIWPACHRTTTASTAPTSCDSAAAGHESQQGTAEVREEMWERRTMDMENRLSQGRMQSAGRVPSGVIREEN